MGAWWGQDCREAPAGQGWREAKATPPAPLKDHKPLTNLLLPGAPDPRHSLMEPVDGLPVGGWGRGLESLERRGLGRGRSSEKGGRSATLLWKGGGLTPRGDGVQRALRWGEAQRRGGMRGGGVLGDLGRRREDGA